MATGNWYLGVNLKYLDDWDHLGANSIYLDE
jgi:hypothetical protein